MVFKKHFGMLQMHLWFHQNFLSLSASKTSGWITEWLGLVDDSCSKVESESEESEEKKFVRLTNNSLNGGI